MWKIFDANLKGVVPQKTVKSVTFVMEVSNSDDKPVHKMDGWAKFRQTAQVKVRSLHNHTG